MSRLIARISIVGAAVLVATATALPTQSADLQPSVTMNPPPSERFAAFTKFELAPLELMPPYKGNGPNEKAAAKIQEHLDSRLGAVVNGWNTAQVSAPEGGTARTLTIQPRVEAIRFIGGAARFWAGALAGSSGVLMKVKFVDAATGQTVAEPEFYQRAAAMSGAWTMGGQDNDMLSRVVDLVVNYASANYGAAIGGPSGAPEKSVKEEESKKGH